MKFDHCRWGSFMLLSIALGMGGFACGEKGGSEPELEDGDLDQEIIQESPSEVDEEETEAEAEEEGEAVPFDPCSVEAIDERVACTATLFFPGDETTPDRVWKKYFFSADHRLLGSASVEMTGPNCLGYTYRYDGNGRLVKSYEFPQEIKDRINTFYYDDLGRLIDWHVSLPRYSSEYGYTYEYNEAGLLIRKDSYRLQGVSTLYEYDSEGRLLKILEETGNPGHRTTWTKTEYAYTQEGIVVNGGGLYTLDDAGFVTTFSNRSDPDSGPETWVVVTEYEYSSGELSRRTRSASAPSCGDGWWEDWVWTRDDYGNILTENRILNCCTPPPWMENGGQGMGYEMRYEGQCEGRLPINPVPDPTPYPPGLKRIQVELISSGPEGVLSDMCYPDDP